MTDDRPVRAFFLTGPPGCGKTSLLREVLSTLGVPAGGFFTEEVREGGRRAGFRLVTLDGRQAMLASVGRPGPVRVGRYGVNVAALDEVGVPALQEAIERESLVVVDEIGKMEMASGAFRGAVERALGGGSVILGTILLASNPWADAIKRRPEVQLIRLTFSDREGARERLVTLLRDCLARRRQQGAATAGGG